MKKVAVYLNDVKTGEGVMLKNEDASFNVREGNGVVRIDTVCHPVAKTGIWQFNLSSIKNL